VSSFTHLVDDVVVSLSVVSVHRIVLLADLATSFRQRTCWDPRHHLHLTHGEPTVINTGLEKVTGLTSSATRDLTFIKQNKSYWINNRSEVAELVRLPGLHLPRRQWSLLTRFRTRKGHCSTFRKKQGLTDNEVYDCGDIQTYNVTHRQLLPSDQSWRWSTTSTHCRRGCRRLADVIWHLYAYTITSCTAPIAADLKTKV